jgi:hypothetical protein
MRKLIVAFFIIFTIAATLAWSQEPAVIPAKPALPVPRWDKGVVEGKTYKNVSVGLELTPDPNLKLGKPELRGKPGAANSSVMVAAWGHLERTRIEGTAFSAIALAYYPEDQRSTDACMRRVAQANQKDGLKPVRGSREGELGGVSFARADFFREGPAYQTVFLKACDTQALIFIFMGSSQDAVDKIIAATELKLDLTRSGCGPKPSDTIPK